jgi:hypothetical protein
VNFDCGDYKIEVFTDLGEITSLFEEDPSNEGSFRFKPDLSSPIEDMAF